MVLATFLILTSCSKKPTACSDVPTSGSVGQVLSFSSSCSTDASTYEWDFGDGTTSTDANPTHAYTATGTFTVKLMAMSDNKKKMSDISKNITIN